MEMTKGEIVSSYNSAKNKRRQIGILADLNGCSKDEIEAIVADTEFNAQNPANDHKEQPEMDKLINWLYKQLDATEGQIKALEGRYKELSVALKIAEEYKEVAQT